MQKIRDKNSLALQNHSLVFTMAEEIISLGCGDDSEVAFDEEILQYLREEWGDSALDEEIFLPFNCKILISHTKVCLKKCSKRRCYIQPKTDERNSDYLELQ